MTVAHRAETGTRAELDETFDDQPITSAMPLTEPADGIPSVVDTDEALAECIAALTSGSGPIAIDAERAGGYRYGHRAYLVQLRRAGAGTHLIDPLAFGDLKALNGEIFGTEWVLHAASQDIPCLTEVGLIPEKLFDTELAARLLGRPKFGLAALTESELGWSLAKEHSAADWSTRPLPEAWLRYAALDVELLIELRDVLEKDLERTGRLQWALQEFDYVRTAPAKAPRKEPWRRTSGIHRVRSPRQLAIVRELWLQREELARDRDVSPGRILPDAAIAAAAAAKPATRAAFAALPAFQGRAAKRRMDLWWESVERALAMATDLLPGSPGKADGPPPPRSWNDRAPEAAARLIRARRALATKSEKLGVSSENLLTPDMLRRLCWSPPGAVDNDSVAEFLTNQGARQWQVELISADVATALSAAAE